MRKMSGRKTSEAVHSKRFIDFHKWIHRQVCITTYVELNYEGTRQRGSKSTVKGGGSWEDRWKGKRKDEETR